MRLLIIDMEVFIKDPTHDVTSNFMKDYLNEDGLNVMSFKNIMIGLLLNGCQFYNMDSCHCPFRSYYIINFPFKILRCDVFSNQDSYNHIILAMSI